MQSVNFEEVLDQVLARDPRYAREAYFFLREALDHTHRMVGRLKRGEINHVSGRELLEGIRAFALEQYGPMAKAVLNEWGVQSCDDFGEIVFNMVDAGLLTKTESDRREDFQGVYSFEDAFLKPFRPSSPRDHFTTAPESRPTEA